MEGLSNARRRTARPGRPLPLPLPLPLPQRLYWGHQSWLGVGVYRGGYRLPYVRARMRLRHETGGNHAWHFTSHRRGASSAASFAASYGPLAPPSAALPGSLDHWLTDRYRVFSGAAAGALWAADVHHLP